MKKYTKYIVTGAIVIVALLFVMIKYWDYMANPWTRDGKVQANVVQIASRVSGPIVNLNIKDNQFVNAGDILFEIDPRTYQAAYDQARAQLDQTGGNVAGLEKQIEALRASVRAAEASVRQAKSGIAQLEPTIANAKAEYDRQDEMLKRNATSVKALQQAEANYQVSVQQKVAAEAGLNQAYAGLAQSKASLAQAEAQLVALGENNPQLRTSIAALRQAELNLEFTKVIAPVDGFITNLSLQIGSQAVANQAVLALVDVNSFWITGYFKETSVAKIKSSNKAVVTLMSYQDTPVDGIVESIGWGIAQSDGSTGYQLLPNVSPTFEWIRLAQRVPVKIKLLNKPEDVQLRVGTTASIMIMTKEDAGDQSLASIPAVPAFLQ